MERVSVLHNGLKYILALRDYGYLKKFRQTAEIDTLEQPSIISFAKLSL